MKDDTELILEPLKSHGYRFYLLVTVLLAIIGLGVYGFVLEYIYGLGLGGDRVPIAWGLNIVDFVYFIAISMAGTIISGILRLSNATWRKPITRIAEAITISALPIGALFPILDLGSPQRFFYLLIYARLQSPISWDTIAISTYLVASLVYFYLPLAPDLAICRDSLKNVSKFRRWLYSKLSLGWSGGVEQVNKLNKSIKIMAILVVPIAVSVHSVLSWVFSVTDRVEWHSTVFPIFFVVGAVYSGLATILIVIYLFRRFYHLERYIEVKHFLYLAYIFLAVDLAMIYLTVSEYLAPAWASQTLDAQYLSSLLTGAYAPYFWFMLVAGFLVPAIIVSVPKTRTIGLIVISAILANIGMWLERFLIVIPALAVPQPPLTYAIGSYTPSWEELSITAAGFAAVALILVVVAKLVPIVSIWELNEGTGVKVDTTPIMPQLQVSVVSESSLFTERRTIVKQGAIAALAVAAGFTVSHYLFLGVLNKEHSAGQPKTQLSSIGERVSQEQAIIRASFPIFIPSSLPPGTTFNQARVSADGAMVGLLYDSAWLEHLNMYADRVDIAVFQIRDQVIDSPPALLPKGYDRVTVKGNPGFARPQSKQPSEPAQIQWWSDGRRCSIFANLPTADLLKIADSMEMATNA
ncbi:MAG: polysulfide reductase NrfD [Nitrososphaerota archaeon]|nr:polysulfide reductase NrfD [Nitrososphaerota archaeon]